MGDDKPRSFNCSLVSWNEIHTQTHSIVNQVQDDDFDPTAVIGVARGGWTPARNVADFLRIDNLTSMKVDHYQGTSKTEDADIVFDVRKSAIEDENVLVVDDIVDTGQSIMEVMNDLKERNANEVRSATVHELPSSEIEPDYVGKRLDKFVWITYPWNATEDLYDFIKNISVGSEWMTHGQVDAKLSEYHNINTEEFADVLDIPYENLIDTMGKTDDLEIKDNKIRVPE